MERKTFIIFVVYVIVGVIARTITNFNNAVGAERLLFLFVGGVLFLAIAQDKKLWK